MGFSLPEIAAVSPLLVRSLISSFFAHPARRLRGWIAEIQGLATLFDRALRALSRAETGEIQAGFSVLSKISDETLDNLLGELTQQAGVSRTQVADV